MEPKFITMAAFRYRDTERQVHSSMTRSVNLDKKYRISMLHSSSVLLFYLDSDREGDRSYMLK